MIGFEKIFRHEQALCFLETYSFDARIEFFVQDFKNTDFPPKVEIT